MNLKSYSRKHAYYYDLIDKDKNYKEECNFLERCFKKYSGRKVYSILDLGCGTGNHDAILSSRGYHVTGMDISKDMIKIANSKHIPHSEFIVGNMADFDLGKKYDTVICMFAAFGYLNNNLQIDSALQCVRRHLKVGGLFIMDCWNGLAVMSQKPEARKRVIQSGDFTITRKSYPILKPLEQICEVNFDISIRHDGAMNKWKEKHPVRFFFPQEVKKYFDDHGLELVRSCPNFKLDSKLDDSDWWVSFIGKAKN